ncbi:MAG: DUF4932 domain-containing protein [Nanoarchaeota archaeon]|nr:DUF4932 domain-containing protein [Nanoarchaeota archaeon]
MKILFKNSRKLVLAYSTLMSCGYEVPKNQITKYVSKAIKISKTNKINFHHSKLVRHMLLIKNLKTFELVKSLNKTDKFDIKLSKEFIPYVKQFYKRNNFDLLFKKIKTIEKNRIKNNQKLIFPLVTKVSSVWKIKKPRGMIIINNPFVNGGHLYMFKNKNIITINLLNKYENMIKHIFCHEFSHFFQTKLFKDMKNEIEEKSHLYKKHTNYSEWESYFAENLVEAVIFTLIRPPPKSIYKKHLEHPSKEYSYIKSIVNAIETHNLKRIGKKELKIILKELN